MHQLFHRLHLTIGKCCVHFFNILHNFVSIDRSILLFTVSELTTKTCPVNVAAFDIDTHALNMRVEIESHIQFFGSFFFAMVYVHEEIQRPTFALFY